MNKKNPFAIINAIYKGNTYTSIPLELIPNSDNLKLILTISESGTSSSTSIKFPTSETKFIVFSKEQLDETLFEIEIIENDIKKLIKHTKKKDNDLEYLKS